jgi:hypothetical protein
MTLSHAGKIRICMEVCIRRTEAAIAALKDFEQEKFAERMRERAMSLYNLRAIDAIAQSMGYDSRSDPENYELATRLRQLDLSLIDSMSLQQTEIQTQLRKIDTGKRRIARYKSRSGERKNLVQTV